MITLRPPEQAGKPLYWQIYDQFKEDIYSGALAAHEKLPSKRKLAADLGVSVTTVDGAYAQLACEGFIEARPKRGYFVCPMGQLKGLRPRPPEPHPPEPEDPGLLVDFSANTVDKDAFPYNTWRKLLKAAFNEYDPDVLKRPAAQGDLELRQVIATYLYSSRGVRCQAEQVIIGAGADHLLLVLGYILGNSFTIALENPVYNKAYQIFRHMGYPTLPIDVDGAGMPATPLQGLENTVVYITPSHQFPLGISMPISRRIQLLHWAEAGKNRYIIEDDYDSEFRYHTRPLPSLQSIDSHDKVIYLGTFTKSIAPALRMGFLVLPPQLLARYKEGFGSFASPISRLEQRVLCAFIRDGYYERHLNKMRVIYGNKRAYLEKALAGAFPASLAIHGENAGHHLLVSSRAGRGEGDLCAAARREGVRVYPISSYFIGPMPPRYSGSVLLGYGGLSEKELALGVACLKRAWGK